MNYANFQRTISLYKVLKISSIKALKTDSFFEQIFIPILNTLPSGMFSGPIHTSLTPLTSLTSLTSLTCESKDINLISHARKSVGNVVVPYL